MGHCVVIYGEGLSVGSLKAFDQDLLQKWRWGLEDNQNTLWVKSIHGDEVGFDNMGCKTLGMWCKIAGSIN